MFESWPFLYKSAFSECKGELDNPHTNAQETFIH